MEHLLRLIPTHLIAGAIGFALSIYYLLILTAQPAPDDLALEEATQAAQFSVQLTRDLRGSDTLYWGEGTIGVTSESIVHQGELAPDPDYKVYLTRDFVVHEDEFEPIKSQAVLICGMKSFGDFVTAGKYR